MATHVTQNTGNNEWYTPAYIIDAAREAMGGIDFDPASCEIANQTVKAQQYITADTNGLTVPWEDRVWLNPPYSRDLLPTFVDKLIDEIGAGHVTQACVLVNNATETKWARQLKCACDAICLLDGRVRFNDATGAPQKTPLQGQMVYYFDARQGWINGVDSKTFVGAFHNLGKCFKPIMEGV